MKADPLRVIEAAYSDVADERAWLQGIVDAAQSMLDDGLGLWANVYTLMPDATLRRGPFVTAGAAVDAEARQLGIDRDSPREVITAAFGRNRVATASEFIGRTPDSRDTGLTPYLHPYQARDVVGLLTVDPNGHGLCISVPLRTARPLDLRFRERWSRLLAHVGAGLRLRADQPTEEAILDASGTLHDAQAFARGREARIALRYAARAIDRARARRRSAPDDAVDQWRALAGGRWSLIDRFESDGRHFLVARPNPPRPQFRGRPLSEREACVVALAAAGRSNKLIAYELGLSVGTVGTLLSRASRKLGVRSRATLVMEWSKRSHSEE